MSVSELLKTLPEVSIAFFDLDETITDEDTDTLWALWRSHLSPRKWLERAWLVKLYRDFRKGRLDFEEYMKFQRFRIGSYSIERYRILSREFFGESGRRHIYRDAAELIGGLKQAGCSVVLLTAQNDCIAAPFAEHLGMDGIIANRFDYSAGGRIGPPVRPFSIGEGKVILGKKHAENAGVPLSRCAYFGDSIYDAAFMESVGFPFAVNPDHMLEERAQRKNWRIVRFSSVLDCGEESGCIDDRPKKAALSDSRR